VTAPSILTGAHGQSDDRYGRNSEERASGVELEGKARPARGLAALLTSRLSRRGLTTGSLVDLKVVASLALVVEGDWREQPQKNLNRWNGTQACSLIQDLLLG